MQRYDYIVDPEGHGTHTTLQAAIDDASRFRARLRRLFRRAVIRVMPGTYRDYTNNHFIDCSIMGLFVEAGDEMHFQDYTFTIT